MAAPRDASARSFVAEHVARLEAETAALFDGRLEQWAAAADGGPIDAKSAGPDTHAQAYLAALQAALAGPQLRGLADLCEQVPGKAWWRRTLPQTPYAQVETTLSTLGALRDPAIKQADAQGRALLELLELYVQVKASVFVYGALASQLLRHATALADDMAYWATVDASAWSVLYSVASELPRRVHEAVALSWPQIVAEAQAAAPDGRISAADATRRLWLSVRALLKPLSVTPSRAWLLERLQPPVGLRQGLVAAGRRSIQRRVARLGQVRTFCAGSLGVLAVRYGSEAALLGLGGGGSVLTPSASAGSLSDSPVAADAAAVPVDELRRRLGVFLAHVAAMNARVQLAVESMAAQHARLAAQRVQAVPVGNPGEQPSIRRLLAASDDPFASSAPAPSISNALAKALEAGKSLPVAMGRVRELYGTPPWYERLWLAGSATSIGLYVVARSAVVNGDLLREWAAGGADTATRLLQDWLWQPMVRIVRTIRHEDDLQLLGAGSLESDLGSLENMVADFVRERQPDSGAAALQALAERTRAGDLSVVLRAYEREIKSPFRSAVQGDLVRLLLIQVQKAKVDLELALSALDKLIRSNELNFALLAVVPTLMLTFAAFRGARALVARRRGLGAAAARRAVATSLVHLDRVLTRHLDEPRLPMDAYGVLLCEVATLRQHSAQLHALSRAGLFEDLRLLEGASFSVSQRCRVLDRLSRSF